MEEDGRRWKKMEEDGRRWKKMEEDGRRRKKMGEYDGKTIEQVYIFLSVGDHLGTLVGVQRAPKKL